MTWPGSRVNGGERCIRRRKCAGLRIEPEDENFVDAEIADDGTRL